MHQGMLPEGFDARMRFLEAQMRQHKVDIDRLWNSVGSRAYGNVTSQPGGAEGNDDGDSDEDGDDMPDGPPYDPPDGGLDDSGCNCGDPCGVGGDCNCCCYWRYEYGDSGLGWYWFGASYGCGVIYTSLVPIDQEDCENLNYGPPVGEPAYLGFVCSMGPQLPPP